MYCKIYIIYNINIPVHRVCIEHLLYMYCKIYIIYKINIPVHRVCIEHLLYMYCKIYIIYKINIPVHRVCIEHLLYKYCKIYIIYNINIPVHKFGIIFFIHIPKKYNKKGQGKQNKTKENYVQRTTIYNNHFGTQQINSRGTAYLLMC